MGRVSISGTPSVKYQAKSKMDLMARWHVTVTTTMKRMQDS